MVLPSGEVETNRLAKAHGGSEDLGSGWFFRPGKLKQVRHGATMQVATTGSGWFFRPGK
jgi:hypothetical protein